MSRVTAVAVSVVALSAAGALTMVSVRHSQRPVAVTTPAATLVTAPTTSVTVSNPTTPTTLSTPTAPVTASIASTAVGAPPSTISSPTSTGPEPSLPTTAALPPDTPAVVDLGGGDSSGEGNDNGPLTTEPVATTISPTPTTANVSATTVTVLTSAVPDAPQTLRLTCAAQPAPVAVRCSWNGLASNESARLLRGIRGSAVIQAKVFTRAAGSTNLEDITVDVGIAYTYQLQSVRADGSVSAVSPLTTVDCCGT
jgi:hypothetical protein